MGVGVGVGIGGWNVIWHDVWSGRGLICRGLRSSGGVYIDRELRGV